MSINKIGGPFSCCVPGLVDRSGSSPAAAAKQRMLALLTLGQADVTQGHAGPNRGCRKLNVDDALPTLALRRQDSAHPETCHLSCVRPGWATARMQLAVAGVHAPMRLDIEAKCKLSVLIRLKRCTAD